LKQIHSLRQNIAQSGLEIGIAATARRFNVNPGIVHYWVNKILKSTHPGQHGGLRHATFWPDEHKLLQSYLVDFVESQTKRNQSIEFNDVLVYFSALTNRKVTPPVLSRLLSSLNWSWKIPCRFQIYKYRLDNMI